MFHAEFNGDDWRSCLSLWWYSQLTLGLLEVYSDENALASYTLFTIIANTQLGLSSSEEGTFTDVIIIMMISLHHITLCIDIKIDGITTNKNTFFLCVRVYFLININIRVMPFS